MDIRIVFFGDSLTFGYGVSKQNSWVNKLAHELSCHTLNKARNGETTTSMLSRYYTDVLIPNPKKIFIMGGSNDLLLGRSVESIIDNIEIMIKDAVTIKAEIIIGIPPKIIGSMANELFSPSDLYDYAENKLPYLKDQIINLCNKYKISFINFYDLILDDALYLDGLHLNASGHELMYKESLPYFL